MSMERISGSPRVSVIAVCQAVQALYVHALLQHPQLSASTRAKALESGL
jgi:hypothetical protein